VICPQIELKGKERLHVKQSTSTWDGRSHLGLVVGFSASRLSEAARRLTLMNSTQGPVFKTLFLCIVVKDGMDTARVCLPHQHQRRPRCSIGQPIPSDIDAFRTMSSGSWGSVAACIAALRYRDPLCCVFVDFDQTQRTILMQLVRVWAGDEWQPSGGRGSTFDAGSSDHGVGPSQDFEIWHPCSPGLEMTATHPKIGLSGPDTLSNSA